MQNKNLKSTALFVLCILLLEVAGSACSVYGEVPGTSPQQPAPTLCAVSTPNVPQETEAPPVESTPLPEAGRNPWEIKFEDHEDPLYTHWATDVGGRYDTEETAPESVKMMIPLIEQILNYRTQYDWCYSDLQFFENFRDTNQHTMENDVYLWGLMSNVLCIYGDLHPNAIVNGDEIRLSLADVQDFLSICFADFPAETTFPDTPPEEWLKQPIELGEDPQEAIKKDGDSYIFKKKDYPILINLPSRHIIKSANLWDESRYKLDFILLFGPDGYDMAVYSVTLQASETPNALGLEWRVAQIVRADTAEIDDC